MFYNCEERKLIGLIIQAITRTIDHFDRQTVAPSASIEPRSLADKIPLGPVSFKRLTDTRYFAMHRPRLHIGGCALSPKTNST